MTEEKKDYDLVIVGGGPAGSSAAFSAAKNGVRVALLEKEEKIAQTVRTSGVTWVKDVKKFEIPKDCYNEIKNYSFCSPNLYLGFIKLLRISPSLLKGIIRNYTNLDSKTQDLAIYSDIK